MDALQWPGSDRSVPLAAMADSQPPMRGLTTQMRICRSLPTDTQFVEMLRRYRPGGGIARRSEIEARLLARSPLGRRVLDGWLDDGAAFAFEWRGQTWLPVFQFRQATMTPRRDVIQIMRELWPTFDGVEMALWFSQPNQMLRGRSPVEMLDEELAAVRQAARFDRYVAS